MSQEPKPEGSTAVVPTVTEFAGKIRSYFDMKLPNPEPPKVWSLAELEDALRSHRAWVESLATPSAPIAGVRACFRGADLRGVNLARRDLRGADFSGANLEGALLQGSLLTHANLTGANLRYADLRLASLKGTELEGAVLDGAKLD